MVDLLELTLISLFSLHGVCRSWLQNLLVVIVPLLKVSVKRGDYVVPLLVVSRNQRDVSDRKNGWAISEMIICAIIESVKVN